MFLIVYQSLKSETTDLCVICWMFCSKVEALEQEVEVMKEVLVDTEAEKEGVEARNKELLEEIESMSEEMGEPGDQVLVFAACFCV